MEELIVTTTEYGVLRTHTNCTKILHIRKDWSLMRSVSTKSVGPKVIEYTVNADIIRLF